MLARQICLAMLTLWSLSARAADPWCSPHGRDVFSFAWTPVSKKDAQHGRVHITEAATGKTIQVLDDVENYYASDDAFGVGDLNHDGCPDLTIVSSVAAIGNESSTAYLYDSASRTFVLNAALSDIGGLSPDPRDGNCVLGSWKGGAEDFYGSRSCWVKGKLVLQSESSVTPLVGQDGQLKCYQHIETKYRAGKKTRRKTCTKQL